MAWTSIFRRASWLALLCATALCPAKEVPVTTTIETPEATWIQVDRPGAGGTYLTGIAANGRICGYSTNDPLPVPPMPIYVNGSGFLLEKNRITDISHPDTVSAVSPVTQTLALKINAQGEIAGWRTLEPEVAASELGFIWRKGRFEPVHYRGPDVPGLNPAVRYDKVTDVMSINASGDMIGQVAWIDPSDPHTVVGGWRAWMYQKGRFQLIDPQGSVETYPHDINEQGEVVGIYWDASANPRHGFHRSRKGIVTEIRVPDDWNAFFVTLPSAINASGEIAGLYAQFPGQPRGFLLRDGEFTRIDFPGAPLTAVWDINARGEIVGSFRDTSGRVHGFIRIPKH
jgi:hypothetical protein